MADYIKNEGGTVSINMNQPLPARTLKASTDGDALLSDKGILRAYVPRKGNCYNPSSAYYGGPALFGCDEESDLAFIRSIGLEDECCGGNMPMFEIDRDAVIEDASARLLACPGVPPAQSSTSKPSKPASTETDI